MNFFTKAFAIGLVMVLGAHVQATETFIIKGALGNGDFNAGGGGTAGGAQTYAATPNWHNASDVETINGTQSTQMGGSTDPDNGITTRGATPFQNRDQVNDTGYTINAAGEVFNLSYDFGAGGGLANWENLETMTTYLFTSNVPVNGSMIEANIMKLPGSTDSYAIDRAGDGQWTSYSSPGFYTTTTADIGKTVYFGMEFLDAGTGALLFPRLDVVTLSTGIADRFLFEFDAGKNPTNGSTEWQPNLDTGPGHADLKGTELFTFASTQTAAAVSNPSFPGLTGSYGAESRGRASYNPTSMVDENGPAFSSNSGGQESAIEVWFKPDSLTGGDQIIAELGGEGRGSYISLQNGTLSYHTNTDNGTNTGSVTLTHTLTSTDWTQVVANWNGAAGEYELFVNKVSVDDDLTGSTPTSFWGGGNAAGLGAVGDSGVTPGNDLAANGPLAAPTVLSDYNFAGEISIFRYYEGVLTLAEVEASFDAIAVTTGQDGDFDGDTDVDGADFLLWQRTLGDTTNLDLWRDNYGVGTPAAAVGAVPEPSSIMLLLSLLVTAGSMKGRQRG